MSLKCVKVKVDPHHPRIQYVRISLQNIGLGRGMLAHLYLPPGTLQLAKALKVFANLLFYGVSLKKNFVTKNGGGYF